MKMGIIRSLWRYDAHLLHPKEAPDGCNNCDSKANRPDRAAEPSDSAPTATLMFLPRALA
jgi:hypothetical protein